MASKSRAHSVAACCGKRRAALLRSPNTSQPSTSSVYRIAYARAHIQPIVKISFQTLKTNVLHVKTMPLFEQQKISLLAKHFSLNLPAAFELLTSCRSTPRRQIAARSLTGRDDANNQRWCCACCRSLSSGRRGSFGRRFALSALAAWRRARLVSSRARVY